MRLHPIDAAIIVGSLSASLRVGYWVSPRASRDLRSYFLGGNVMPWCVLDISDTLILKLTWYDNQEAREAA